MIFAKCFQSEDHIRAFVVNSPAEGGWEVLEQEDNQVVKRTRLHDWHRVENAMMRFGIKATQLQGAGWIEIQAPASIVV